MRWLILITLLYHTSNVLSQGCSDAGFCTMGAMRPDQPYNKQVKFKLKSIVFDRYKGTTDPLTAIVRVNTLDFNFGFNDKISFQIKVPYQTVSGNLTNFDEAGKVAGLGDISISTTHNIFSKDNLDINISFGTKIPSNNSSKKDDNGFDYPMYYQTSLGTYDAIFGGAILTRDWLFATGVQIPLNRNENQWKWSEWEHYPSPDYLKLHSSAVNLKRGSDVMLRAERNFRFTNFNFNIGVLTIYRVNKDEILKDGARQKLDNTTGFAISALSGIGYNFDVNNSIKVIYGIKLIDREVNPDGLTRHDVTSISYVYRF